MVELDGYLIAALGLICMLGGVLLGLALSRAMDAHRVRMEEDGYEITEITNANPTAIYIEPRERGFRFKDFHDDERNLPPKWPRGDV